MDGLMLAFGEDFLWWTMPTHPELRINYFERVWPKKEIKKMYKSEEFDRKQDHSDPDKKQFFKEQKVAQLEKKIVWGGLAVAVVSWVFIGQDLLIERNAH